MAVSKIYKTRLASVVGNNENGVEIRGILEDDGFAGADCTFVAEPGTEPASVKVYLNGIHIGYLMKGVAKTLAPQLAAGKIVHGYIKALSCYDKSKESITRWDASDDEERLMNCYINVWSCDSGDDESACYDLLKQQATAAGVLKPEQNSTAAQQPQKVEKRGIFAALFGKK